MPTLRDIKRRIKAVENTSKITKAMKMVSAAKFRKAQQRMFEMRPYADRMSAVLSGLSSGEEGSGTHPLLVQRPRKKIELLVITSDRGLCGAFNSNILKAASRYMGEMQKEGVETGVSSVGRKARDYFRRRNIQRRNAWTGISGKLSYSNTQEIAGNMMESFTNETIDEVILIYNEFKTVVAQKVIITRLLPMTPIEAGEAPAPVYLYEPSREAIFEKLVPKNVEIQIYRALLESQAAEEAARMAAMENATKAAKDMISSLTLQFNKARQASITKELMDIVGGVEALKG
jgi:F-type H+-transporting ATPase subunit gamma